jgi:isoleucyl-tRNA synthetase
VPKAEFRRLCREYATTGSASRASSFSGLGVLGHWDGRYATMDFPTEAAIVPSSTRC